MSRYVVYRGDRTAVAYGFDAPTGGYFWHRYNDDEELNFDEGLTLSELEHSFVEHLGMTLTVERLEKLAVDFYAEDAPTRLQIAVGKHVGKDVIKMLKRVKKDVDARMKKHADI